MPYITVLTPTYNRVHTLPRVFDSLCKQEFSDFDWVVVDDGSTDGTKELIEGYQKTATFPISYYYKENGGKHTAINYALDVIESPYVHIIDSDDALTDNALSLIKKNWEKISPEDYDRFWCVSGLCFDSQTGELVGKPFPPGINDLKGRAQHKVIVKYPKDKSCCRKLSVLQEFPFPVFPDTKFVSEGMVWEKINKKYDQYCTNDVFRIYYTDSPDSLAAGKMHSSTRWRTYYYVSLFFLNECFDQITYNKKILRALLSVSRCAMLSHTGINELMHGLNAWYKRVLVFLGYPIAWVIIKFQRIPY
ncbi:MAG: glycosyltransferase family 2 protein [Peptostreptococcaceae bacterium]|nr:glycosyltransferase family 2 protein [Peptostreptococcaceae bacterium]